MVYCETIWCQNARRRIEVTEDDRDHCHQTLLQVSPSLTRILQLIPFITYPSESFHPYYYAELLIFKIHVLLDFSWDELRMAFCSLRSLIGHEGDGFTRNMPIIALDMALSPAPILWELTHSCLCVMRRIISGEVDKAFE